MMRWAVDVAGLDVTADLKAEEYGVPPRQSSALLLSSTSATTTTTTTAATATTTPSTTRTAAAAAGTTTAATAAAAAPRRWSSAMWRPACLAASPAQNALGAVDVLTLDEVQYIQRERIATAVPILAGTACAASVLGGSHSASARVERGDSSNGLLDDASLDTSAPAPLPTLSVYSTFVSPDGARTAVTVCMPRAAFRGVDVVNAFLQQIMTDDEQLAERYSSNARLYKLFIADEVTGEEEMAVQLDLAAQNFSCYAVQPLPAAKLTLFPQRTDLLPAVPDDVPLRVLLRAVTGATPHGGGEVQRVCLVAPDVLAEALETVLTRRLPACGIVQGSLRVRHGPLELNINEYYNFGPGCGQANCPIAEHTVLTLHRFGVSEVVVTGRHVEVAGGAEAAAAAAGTTSSGGVSTSAVVPGGVVGGAAGESAMPATEDIVVEMSLDEAMSFQEFEVVAINRYGARQQRLLCVDGEHLYTMRPNIFDTLPKTTERAIADIVEVRRDANKAQYIEVVYSRGSGFEPDRFECTTAYNCALLDEKLHLLRRELRKRAAEQAAAAMHRPSETALQRFFAGVYRRLRRNA